MNPCSCSRVLFQARKAARLHVDGPAGQRATRTPSAHETSCTPHLGFRGYSAQAAGRRVSRRQESKAGKEGVRVTALMRARAMLPKPFSDSFSTLLNPGCGGRTGNAEVFEEHLWEAAAAEVDMGIPRSSREVG